MDIFQLLSFLSHLIEILASNVPGYNAIGLPVVLYLSGLYYWHQILWAVRQAYLCHDVMFIS